MRWTRGVTIVAFALAGCTHTKAPAPPTAAKPKIVVALVVDQLPSWLARSRISSLPADGGFARLSREGTWATHAVHGHANTDTAPGHAALFTGLPPRSTGIVANEIVDEHGYASILRDPDTRLVSTDGETTAPGSSIARLRVSTVADLVRAQHPETTIVSVSLKDRGAIFGGGRHPDATIWFDTGLDRFVTSTAFAKALPGWAKPHATHETVVALRAAPWTPLDRPWLLAHATTPDDQPGEGDWDGLGVTFPHSLATAKRPSIPFRATPFADDAVLALALAAIQGRSTTAPMLLSVSFSANDYILHVFGPESWEAWDELRRIDRSLARLFAELDAAVGPDGWSAVLSSDHGGPRALPERTHAENARIFPEALAAELEEVAEKTLGPGRWVYGVADPMVYLSDAAHALDPERRKALDEALLTKLRADPRLTAVFVNRSLPEACAPERIVMSVEELVCRSASRDSVGDLYLVARDGVFFDTRYAVGKGVNHGSPWADDRTVPFFARAPGRIAAGVVDDAPRSASTYTRTLAMLLGVE
ncbi:MAG: alkaline phosphatase family protein [Polyangiales bacterium]